MYINRRYLDKLLKFNFSNDLEELLDNENKILNLYKEVKQIGLN